MSTSFIAQKSKSLALQIINLYKSLQGREWVISRQICRSGTSIAANIYESVYSPSDADRINKLNISLKEANETKLWLELLVESNYIDQDIFNEIYSKNEEMIALLISSIKTIRKKQDDGIWK